MENGGSDSFSCGTHFLALSIGLFHERNNLEGGIKLTINTNNKGGEHHEHVTNEKP